MFSRILAFSLCVFSFTAQADIAQAAEARWPDKPVAEATTALVSHLPPLPVTRSDLALPADVAGKYGMISSIAVNGKTGVIYLLQRGDKADPIVAVDKDGHVLRTWGKGLFSWPHGIRVDPEGNIWTTGSSSSLIQKFTPEGKKLLAIPVGGQPAGGKFNGTTDIAFGPNGRIFISDGYGNARIIEYTSDGKKVREWGEHGLARGRLQARHAQ